MKYVTIEREFGSGGTRIAMELANRLELPCYGQEILQLASRQLNLTMDAILDYEERATGSLLYSLYVLSQSHVGNGEMLPTEGKVFVEEQNAIRELARQGSAIFLGHCASEALKENDQVIRVFIHADAESKRRRIQEDYGVEPASIAAVEKKNNRRRAKYYQANTQKKWDDLRNYDVVLDSGRLGLEQCVNLLQGLF